jgi:hypothetical protein
MNVIFSEPGRVLLEHDPANSVYVMHWHSYLGPHYRKAIEALLASVKKTGARVYISDASRPTDVQSQDDLKWIATVARQLPANGVKQMIVVLPKSSIAKMGAKRLGSTMVENGLERHEVASMEDALALSRRLAAA